MNRLPAVKTFDLGDGWWLNLNEDGGATLRSPDRGQRVNLPRESVEAMRNALEGSERLLAPAIAGAA